MCVCVCVCVDLEITLLSKIILKVAIDADKKIIQNYINILYTIC